MCHLSVLLSTSQFWSPKGQSCKQKAGLNMYSHNAALNIIASFLCPLLTFTASSPQVATIIALIKLFATFLSSQLSYKLRHALHWNHSNLVSYIRVTVTKIWCRQYRWKIDIFLSVSEGSVLYYWISCVWPKYCGSSSTCGKLPRPGRKQRRELGTSSKLPKSMPLESTSSI